MSTTQELASAYEYDAALRRAKPLNYWRPSSEPQDYLIRQFYRGVYSYATTANRGGKGEAVGAAVIALMQGRETLNGYSGKRRELWRGPIPIPELVPPVIGILSGESYKAMSLASIQTLRKMLGPGNRGTTWDEEHAGNPDYVSLFRIKHSASRDKEEWSKLYIFPYDGALPEGGGLDFWWCDEPPPPRFLSTLSTRVAAGRLLRQVVTATPQEKQKWYPISREFADVSPQGFLKRWPDREVRDGRMRIKWPVRANESLGPNEIEQLERNAKGKPFEKSILNGDEVDVAGGCPWSPEVLAAMAENTRPPIRTEMVDIEASADGTKIRCKLQVWEDWKEGEPCYVAGDPAKGISGSLHDPDGMHVRSRVTDRLKARLVGHIGAWALGHAMADMHFRYGGAICDPLVTGGYGIATVQALRKRGVRSFTRHRVEIEPGEWKWEIGTNENEKFKQQGIEALDRSIGDGTFTCQSYEVIQAMQDCTVDGNGKVVQVDKKHLPEDLSCWLAYEIFKGEWDAPKPRGVPLKRYENPNVRILKAIEKRDEEIALKYAPKIGPALARRIGGNGNGNGVVHIEP